MKRKANDLDLDSIEARKAAKIHHLNPGAVDKKDPCLNLIEVEKADNSHHLNVGEKDKNHPGLKTPTSTPTNEPGSKSIYDRLVANIALDYYNNKNESKFKLMEGKPFESTPVIDFPLIRIVCTFIAMEDSSIKKFSARLIYAYPRGLIVRSCKVIEADVHKLTEPDNEEEEDSDFAYESPMSNTSDHSPSFNLDAVFEHERLRIKRIAEFALNLYNNQKGAKYELVQDDAINNCLFYNSSGCWFHTSFHAVDTAESSSFNHLFFAEVKYNYPSEPIVKFCEKLTNCKTTYACPDCKPGFEVKHPAGEDGELRGDRAIVEEDIDPKNENPHTTSPHPYDYWGGFITDVHAEICKVDMTNVQVYEDFTEESPTATPINEPEEPCREPHRIYEILCANIALDYYNNKNDLKFKLVEDDTLDGKPVVGSSGISIRCSFNAKEDSSIKQFFAELQYPPGLTVATCKVSEVTSLENNKEDLKHDKDYAGEDRDSVDKQDCRFDEILEELRAIREEIWDLKENQNAIMRLLKKVEKASGCRSSKFDVVDLDV